MNFIDKIECVDTEIEMELKYCERCGGLFLRLVETDLVYCAACTTFGAKLLARSEHQGRRVQRITGPRLKTLQRGKIERAARIDNLQGAACVEVRV